MCSGERVGTDEELKEISGMSSISHLEQDKYNQSMIHSLCYKLLL